MRHETPPRILLVEDDADTAGLLIECLQDHFGPNCVRQCPTIAQARAIDVDHIDMVLSDINLPDGTGLMLLGELLERRPDMPVVLITGEGILDNALQAIRQGAYDYIVKAGDYLFAVPLVLEKNLATWRTKQLNLKLQEQLTRTLEQVRIKNQQLEEAVLKLEAMAATDPLTGVANRRAFNLAMDRSFAACQRYGHDLACIMIDMDSFKTFNDTLGHQRGDELLQLTARVLEANCRRSDVPARFGGDEFIVLLPETDVQTALLVANRVSDEFVTAARARFHDTPVIGAASMSMGLATIRHSLAASPEQLITFADQALYRAKAAGKACVMVHEPAPKAPASAKPTVKSDR